MSEGSVAAYCSQHPEKAAVATCFRCGDFKCEECVWRTPAGLFCTTCLSRPEMATAMFPLTASSWSLGSVVSLAHRLLVSRTSDFVGAGAVYLGALFVLQVLNNLSQALLGGGFAAMNPNAPGPSSIIALLAMQGVGILVYVLVDAWLRVGILSMGLAACQGRAYKFTELFRHPGKAVPFFLIGLITGVPIMLAAALLGLGAYLWAQSSQPQPGLPLWLGLAALGLGILITLYLLGPLGVAQVVLVDQNRGLVGSIKEGWRLTHRQRWATSGAWIVYSILGGLGACACYVGLIYTFPLSLLCMVVTYLALCNRPGERLVTRLPPHGATPAPASSSTPGAPPLPGAYPVAGPPQDAGTPPVAEAPPPPEASSGGTPEPPPEPDSFLQSD